MIDLQRKTVQMAEPSTATALHRLHDVAQRERSAPSGPDEALDIFQEDVAIVLSTQQLDGYNSLQVK